MKRESNKKRHPKKGAFLTAYAACGNVSHAAKAAGVSRKTHYQWLREDQEYGNKFRDAHNDFCESLEGEIVRRGRDGYEKPVFYQGVQVATVREFSDTLLIFAAKASLPEKYRENHVHTHEHEHHSDDVRVSIEHLLSDPDYVNYLCQQESDRDCDAGAPCQEALSGKSRPMANGSASKDSKPGTNGHHGGPK